MGFIKPSQHKQGDFFKPADHLRDQALLFEPKSVKRDVAKTFTNKDEKTGEETKRDVVSDEWSVDISIFKTSESLDDLKPDVILRNMTVSQKGITTVLEVAGIGGVVPGIVEMEQKGKGRSFVLGDVTPKVEAKLEAYLEKRTADREAAKASQPSFDD